MGFVFLKMTLPFDAHSMRMKKSVLVELEVFVNTALTRIIGRNGIIYHNNNNYYYHSTHTEEANAKYFFSKSLSKFTPRPSLYTINYRFAAKLKSWTNHQVFKKMLPFCFVKVFPRNNHDLEGCWTIAEIRQSHVQPGILLTIWK